MAGNMWILDGPNFRQARADDLERIVELDAFAYPAPMPRAERERSISRHALGGLSDLFVAEMRGEIVAQAFLFKLVTCFGGRPVKTGGVAFVAVAPEARGRGLGTRLMDYIHRQAERRGAAITMLYAFRHGFYARLGYALASSRKRLSFDPRAVPRSWAASSAVKKATSRAAIERVFARVAARSSGVHLRPRAFWNRFLARESLVIWMTARGDGYVAFDLRQSESHGETVLVISELVAENAEARRGLLAAVATMGDQVAHIEHEVAENDPLAQVLLDPDRRRFGTADVEHSLGELVGGPMVRLANVEAALQSRGYLVDGAFAVEVDGPPLGVRVKAGQATLVSPKRLPVLRTTRAGLAAILYGGLSLADAVALGVAEDPGDERVDSILGLPPVTPFDAF